MQIAFKRHFACRKYISQKMGLLVFMSEEAVIETKKENLNVISEAEQESAIIAEAPAEEIKKIIGEPAEAKKSQASQKPHS